MSSAISRRNSLRTRLFLQALEDRRTPATFTVNSLLDDGSGAGNAGTLRYCINEANALAGADTIDFSVTGTITLGGTALPDILSAGGKLDILGPGASQVTIDANDLSRVVGIQGGATVVIDGLTITGGSFAGNGGAILNSGDLSIRNSVFNLNSGGQGGAINSFGPLSIVNSTFSGNVASNSAGAVYVQFSTQFTVNGSTFSANSSFSGGGAILVNTGITNIINSTLSGNSTSSNGGAIYSNYGDVSVLNSTITNNSGNGGGIHGRTQAFTGSLKVTSSVISGNSGSSPDINFWGPNSVDVNFSAIGSSIGFTMTGSNNLPFGEDIKLGSLGNNGGPTETHLPALNSPLLNAGSNPLALATDQRGTRVRAAGGQADIGAVEVSQETKSLVVTTTSDVVDDFDDLTSLREAIAFAHVQAGADTIAFDPTVFASAQTITVTTVGDTTAGPSAFAITSDITIQGPTGNNGVTINGGGAISNNRFAWISSSGSLTLSHLTISNFRHHGGAGGERSGGAAGLGGAIFNQGTLTVTNSTLSGNIAEGGIGGPNGYYSGGGGGLGGNGAGPNGGNGGGPNGGSGGPAPTAGGFGGGGGGGSGGVAVGGTGGFGGGGGGGYATGNGGNGGFGGGGGGSGTFGGNGGAGGFGGGNGTGGSGGTGEAGGGGAGMGGAIFNAGGVVIMTNATLAANAAFGGSGGSGIGGAGSGFGGAVFNLNGAITLMNNTLADNAAAGASSEGSALYSLGLSGVVEFAGGPNVGPANGAASASLTNSIFADGTGVSDIISDNASGNATVSGTNNLATQVSNLPAGVTSTTTVALNLGVLGNNGGPTQTIPLLPGSSAIAAATVAGAPTTDQRGIPRHGAPDIGAFEAFRESLVVTTTNDEDDGTSDPFFGTGTSLREAINYANSRSGADTVTFDATVFASAQTITLGGTQITFTDFKGATTVAGTGAAKLTVDGDDQSRVFGVDGGATAVIDGMTITNGSASGNGGGIYNAGDLTLTNSVVSGNISSDDGGGIYTDSGNLSISDSSITGNSADSDGGGIHNYNSDVTITNSTISGNSASNDGGGIYNYYGDVTVTTSTISGNSADSDGGGIYNYDGDVEVTSSTVSGNSANGDGGGIYNYLGQTTVTDSTLSGNSAGDDGGGIYGYEGTVNVTNSTLSGNSAADEGGGIYNYDSNFTILNSTITGNSAGNDGGGIYSYIGSFTVANSIIAGNTASNSNDVDGSATVTFSLIGDSVGLTFETGSSDNIIDAKPLLGPLGNYGGPTQTVPLLPGSPAINAGNSTLTLDQRGQPRVGTADIGAFESQGFKLAAKSGSGQSTKINAAFSNSLIVTVTANNAFEPVDGGVVKFVAPGSGASATLTTPDAVIAGGEASTTAKANGTVGTYNVTASTIGVPGPASFSLSNLSIGVYAVGTGSGIASKITVYDNVTNAVKFTISPFVSTFLGGVRVATGDVNGDGVLDIIASAGPGGGPHVKVFDGTTGTQLPGPIGSFFAYNANFKGGVFVAAGDVDGDSKADVITGAGAGGGPHVIAFNGATGSLLTSFFAYNANFTGGVSVAAGDIAGDSKAEIITGAGAGGGPHVAAFDGTGKQLKSFFAYNPAFSGGVFVAAGDINGDGKDDIITGAGQTGGPHVKVFDGVNLNLLQSLFAYNNAFSGGVRVASGNFGAITDGIITGAGPGGGPHVKVFNADLTERANFFADPVNSVHGVYVG